MAELWAYTRHELLYLAWAVLEVALLAPLVIAVMSWTRLWPVTAVAVWMFLVMLIPFNLNRLLTLYQVPVNRQRPIILSALLVTVIISVRGLLYESRGLFDFGWLSELVRHFVEPANPLWGSDLGLFFLVLFLWWRGLSLARRSPNIDEMGLRLRAGSLLIAPVVVGVAAVGRTPVLGFVVIYFVAALVAVSLTRAEEISLERTGRSYPLRARWLGMIGLTSVTLVVVAALVAVALSGRGLEQVVGWLAPFWIGLRFFAGTLVSIVSYLAFYLLTPVFWVMGRIAGWLRTLNVIPQVLEPDEPPLEIVDPLALLQQMARQDVGLDLWVNRVLTVLFVGLILYVIYLTVSRFLHVRHITMVSEEREGAGEAERAGAGLGERLRKRLGFWQQRRAAASVRRIYREMSALAGAYGYGRATAQTPYEYVGTLAELWPDGRDECNLITQAYVRVRYGELPETEEELVALRRAWERLRQLPPPEDERPET
jgi:hypothetical protein